MKRIPVIAIFILFVFFQLQAQLIIKPAKGFDKIRPGMDISKAIDILGKPLSHVSNVEEKAQWEAAGYKTKTRLVFNLGFDKVYIFENSNEYAIWKIYTKEEKVVYINMSSFVYGSSTTDKIKIKRGLGFYDKYGEIEKKLGNGYLKNIDAENNKTYIFLRKGIVLIMYGDEIRNICLFKKLNRKQSQIITGKLKK